MGKPNIDVLIVGAGVSGLTTALRLAEAGRVAVRVLAREEPRLTTSCAAGALWGPVGAEHELTDEWSHETLDMLTGLADRPGTGVRLRHGLEASHVGIDPPTWLAALRDLAPCPAAELPPGYRTGWRYTAPLVDMPVYLDYLVRRLAARGVRVETGEVRSLRDPPIDAPVVVNCAGSGARDLVPDPAVVPVRGEVVVVRNPGVREFFADVDEAEEVTYFFPHGDRVVLGSTAHGQRTDARPDPLLAAGIVERCAAIAPALGGAEILGHRVGFRPSRTGVRVEPEEAGGRLIVHNYGHGGGGVSLSWGCAGAVARLVHDLTR